LVEEQIDCDPDQGVLSDPFGARRLTATRHLSGKAGQGFQLVFPEPSVLADQL